MALLQQDIFHYQINFLALANGAQALNTLQVDASANFKWLYASYTADVALAAQTESSRVYPLVTVLLTPTDTTSQLMSAPVPIPNIFGNGENPFILPVPRILIANSSMSIQATNYSAATTYNLFLTMSGIKQYVG